MGTPQNRILNLISFSFGAALLSSCQTNHSKAHISWQKMEYAKNFSIYSLDSNLQILQTFQGTDTVSYVLYKKGRDIPDSLQNLIQIEYPVARMVTMAAPNWGHLLHLNSAQVVVGLSLKSHVVHPYLRNRIDNGIVKELGQSLSEIRIENLVQLAPQVVTASAGPDASAFEQKLTKTKIPLIQIADYLEEHPLGRAEWSKVFGLLVDQKANADFQFEWVKNQYLKLKALGKNTINKPKVLWGSTYMGSWYVAGGLSYQAELMRDAGADYLFNDLQKVSAVPLTLEQVLQRADQAQIWLNPDFKERKDALNEDSRYRFLKALNGPIWKYDLAKNQEGLLGIYEQGVARPDLQLMDLIQIFHPELALNHKMNFYRKL